MKLHFIQNIFSVINEDEFKVITLLGIKIKFFNVKKSYKILNKKLKKEISNNNKLKNELKNINKQIKVINKNVKLIKESEYKNIYNSYRFYGASNELMQRLSYLAQSVHYWKCFDKKTWLVYISCLLDKNQESEALKILQKYIYFYDYEYIEHFYVVAKFAYTNGFINEQIEKSALVYDMLQKAQQENILMKMLDNKTVAIVGNSPSLLGNNKGQEIDSHDIVIRFNNFTIKGYEQDCGTKTNIWCCGLMKDINLRDEKFSMVLNADNTNRLNVPQPNILYDAIKKGSDIYSFSNSYTDNLRLGLNYNPTQGLILIYNLAQMFESLDKIDFYGFNFCSEQHDKFFYHYFKDRDEEQESERRTSHDLLSETEFILNLLKTKKYKLNNSKTPIDTEILGGGNG